MPSTVRLFYSLVILFSLSIASLIADEHEEINLWPSGAVPDEPEGIEKRKKPTTVDKVGKMRIAYVDAPSITVYKAPKDKSNGASVIIFPVPDQFTVAIPSKSKSKDTSPTEQSAIL